jgi:hypothetical protein
MHKKVSEYYETFEAGKRVPTKMRIKSWHTKTSKRVAKRDHIALYKKLNSYLQTLGIWKDELYALEKEGLIGGYKQITGSFGIIEKKLSKLMEQVVNKAIDPNVESKKTYDDLSNKLSKLDSKKERMRKRYRSLQSIYGIDPANLKSMKKKGKKHGK